ncbi:hypothetical protein Tco_1183303 [Tanacetum coccineum]
MVVVVLDMDEANSRACIITKESLEVTWMYWSMEDAKYKDVDSVLAIVPLNKAAIGLKESDKATYGLLNII